MTEFASQNPVLTFLIVWVLAWAFTIPFRLFFRHLNIRAHGWPPGYLDADGDVHRPKKCEDVEASAHQYTTDIQPETKKANSQP